MDTMNIQRLDFASGLSHQDILIKYLESFVELSTKPLQPVDDDVDFAIKVGKHALKPLEVEVRVIRHLELFLWAYTSHSKAACM